MTTAITQIEIRSFMGIEEATLSIEDGVTVISGQNGAGKTSAVLALLWAIAGRAGSVDQPVRIGDDEATVRVFAAGEYEYEITRSQKAGGKSSLTVRRDGAPVARPQEVLDALIGTLAFDPLAFAGMNAKDQVRTLLTAFDADIDLDQLDREHADLEAARRDVGRDRDKAKGHAASIEVPDDTPDTPIDIATAIAALDAAKAHNHECDERQRAVARLQSEVEAAEDARNAAQNRLNDAVDAWDAAKRAVTEIDAVDTDPLSERVANAEAINAAVRAKTEKAAATAETAAHAAKWAEFDAKMKANRQARADAVAAIGVPIDGFDLTDNGVTVDGVPSSQWSTAQAIRIGAAIFGAGDRDLRVMWVKDGSLCDAASRAEIARIARDTNTQVFIEVVGSEAGAIHFENGQVAS